MSAFLIDRHVMHYESVGRGRPVIFVHNFIGSWRYWLPTMEYLGPDFKCYALDLWGFGDSGFDPALATLDQHVSQLGHFLTHLGIGQVALVGHGYGALVAQKFAELNRNSVNRLVSIHHKINPSWKKAPGIFQTHNWLASQKLPEAVLLDCLKAKQVAVANAFANSAAAEWSHTTQGVAANLPHLVIQYGEMHGTPTHSGRITISKQTLFPMAQNAEELNRLLREFLVGSPIVLNEGLSLKEFWKRRVR